MTTLRCSLRAHIAHECGRHRLKLLLLLKYFYKKFGDKKFIVFIYLGKNTKMCYQTINDETFNSTNRRNTCKDTYSIFKKDNLKQNNNMHKTFSPSELNSTRITKRELVKRISAK